MAMQATANLRRDPDVLYDWLEANLRYRMTGPAPTSSDADAGSHKSGSDKVRIMRQNLMLRAIAFCLSCPDNRHSQHYTVNLRHAPLDDATRQVTSQGDTCHGEAFSRRHRI